MVFRHHREIDAWKLAHQLRVMFMHLLKKPEVRRDFDFCNQTRSAARSACRNIAEGFWRFGPREFARFVNFARGSLGELLDSTDELLAAEHITNEEYQALNDLIDRALQVTNGLHRYLRNAPDPNDSNWFRNA